MRQLSVRQVEESCQCTKIVDRRTCSTHDGCPGRDCKPQAKCQRGGPGAVRKVHCRVWQPELVMKIHRVWQPGLVMKIHREYSTGTEEILHEYDWLLFLGRSRSRC